MPRDTTPPTPNRPNKRTRVFRACQYCVNAKTRCEDVQINGGCYLCRRKGKECSLAGLVGGSLNNSENDNSNNRRSISILDNNKDELIVKVEKQEEKYKDLEEKFKQLEEKFNNSQFQFQFQNQNQQQQQNGLSPNNSIGSILSQTQKIVPPKHYAVTSHPLLINSWHINSPVFDENLFGATDPNSLPDVVELGLLTKDQLEMGFQLFKHRFSLIYPFYPFLLSSTNRPKNNFINLVILYYINNNNNNDDENENGNNNNGILSISEENLIKLIEQSIFAILSGSVNNDSIFGLFILSLSPVKKNISPRSQPSSLRMISLAYQIGKSLGIEQKVENALKDKESLIEPWSEMKLDLVLLWTAIINRYNILHIISTPYSTPIPSPAFQLPSEHPSETVKITINHLRGEAELVNCVEECVLNLNDNEIEWTPEKSEKLIEDSKIMRKNLDEFRRTSLVDKDITGLISIDSRCIEFSLIIRLAVINQKLPSPISPLIRLPGLHSIGQSYLPTSLSLLNLLNDNDDNRSNYNQLPSYIILSICAAFVCMRRAIVFVSQHHPQAHLTEYDILKITENNLFKIGGSPKLIVKHTNLQLGYLNDHFELIGNTPINNDKSSNEENQLNNIQNNIQSTSISQLPQNHMQQQQLPQQNHQSYINTDFPPFDWSTWDWSNFLVDPSFEQTGN